MEIAFVNIGEGVGVHYARSPRTEKSGSKRFLTLQGMGITHIIMISGAPESDPNLMLSGLEKLLKKLAEKHGDDLLKVSDEEINGNRVTFINYLQYQISGNSYEITDRAQRIFVFGARFDKEKLKLYVYLPKPGDGTQYLTDIRLEMKYTRTPYFEKRIETKIFERKEALVDTGFDQVWFEDNIGYEDGMINYEVAFRERAYLIPITRDMIGKTILIKRPFKIKVNGITLTQVKAR